MPKLLQQVPAILKAVRQEHEWLQEIVKEYAIDAVISDNRYGLQHKEVPCVIMTHQLNVITGMGDAADGVLRGVHYKYLERFNECWVVDREKDGLGGKLSHPKGLPDNAKYIGLLSQVENTTVGQDYLLILLSGPEPQRGQ